MSNQIRPVSRAFEPDDAVVIEIAIESAVSAFTYAVFATDETDEEVLVTAGWRPKSPTSTRRPASEHSITLDPVPEGDYAVRLYNGRPEGAQSPDDVAFLDFVQTAQVLDEDAFSVAENVPAGIGAEAADAGEPLRISLVRDGVTTTASRPSAVTYLGFREYLRSHGFTYDFPTFGGAQYVELRNAARSYVTDASHLTAYDDLIPAGYLAAKEAEAGIAATGGQDAREIDELVVGDRAVYLRKTVERSRDRVPGVELIWNYWLEEGMLVQTLNVILARFQNRRLPGRDPLVRFDVTPLLPLRNKLWGFAEDEVHRMTIRRRALEYKYELGFDLIGRAVPRGGVEVERRSGFLPAFHQVLFLAHQYFKELDDLTIQADSFPLYRALRDCHIVLSQGSQNQYGEMAVAARAEFLVMQDILAEPQMREFLGGRPMTPYPEPWMDRVDSMKAIQGWTDTSIMHFHDLASIGEQLVLTIRLGNWVGTSDGTGDAATWAKALRGSIQQYAAAYRTATGVDLAREANAEMPSTLLARKLAGNRIRA
ncbi:hypothetical protein [Nocardioides jiangxiensis]|uniref:Uncharacterized protein n=1 Tax=Nocardioides jiangxiensis TaxID=3064524 RepID=A0ABT9AWH5_9ACTN|nr:hypothetical protein [Nocardioides sp. WY-20]MDO7866772.1 hypothetical protein [Nocardioides sp. WY-20]